jgi:sigma-B regulation protein RsbU (phosphoserine phosphatase)
VKTRSIKNKILSAMLGLAAGVLLLLSGSVLFMALSMNRFLVSNAGQFGEEAAANSSLAMQGQVTRVLAELALDMAYHVDSQLRTIESRVRVAAEIASNAYTYKDNFINDALSDRITLLHDGDIAKGGLSILLAPGVGLGRLRSEIGVINNIGSSLEILNANVVSPVYVGSESGYFLTTDTSSVATPGYDPRQRSWYIRARDGGPGWTEIFQDSAGRGASISYAEPIFDRSSTTGAVVEAGKFVGVVEAGSVLERDIKSIIDKSKIGISGYAFIIDDAGTVIVRSSDSEQLDLIGVYEGLNLTEHSDVDIRKVAASMLTDSAGVQRLVVQGIPAYAAYAPLGTIDWGVCIMTPEENIITPAKVIQEDILRMTQASQEQIQRSIVTMLAVWFLVIVASFAAVVIAARGLARVLTTPILKLTDGARVIAAGDLSHKLEAHTGDELEMLSNAFNAMIQSVQQISGEKERIKSELELAWQIQKDMLPALEPRYAPSLFIDLYAKTEPARETGGDFYDFFYLDEAENKLALVIGDVSGKGVPSALFMVITKTLIKQRLLAEDSGDPDPAECLEDINKILSEDNPNSMFVTVFLLILNLETGEAVCSSGGHPPPLLVHEGGSFSFMRVQNGVPPGMMAGMRYPQFRETLSPGDRLYLYTDGVIEAMNGAHKQFGKERLLQAAEKFRGEKADAFDEGIRGEIYAWADGAEQSDDITTVALGWKARKHELRITAEVASLPVVQSWAGGLMEAAGVPPAVQNQLAVVLEEAFVNIASYAYVNPETGELPELPGEALLRIAEGNGSVALQLEDAGWEFDPLAHEPAEPAGEGFSLSIGGRGIGLMQKWTDSMTYKRDNGRNVLTLTRKFDAEV